MNFADQLMAKVQQRGNALCVGLDPRYANLPPELKATDEPVHAEVAAQAAGAFCRIVIDQVKDLVPLVKPQSAFFEAWGPAGVRELGEVVQYARQQDLLVLMDAKRGDIGSTAAAYAEAYLGTGGGSLESDALTVNPYMGGDTLLPFVDAALAGDRGVFVLVKTSNPGSGQFQDRKIADSESTLFELVAAEVEKLSSEHLGASGYGPIGAVVGATYPRQLASLRQAMPHSIFLIPGFGAQGGGVAEVRPGFDASGLGAVVNSSRGIIFAYERPEYQNIAWREAIRRECEKTAEQLSIAALRS